MGACAAAGLVASPSPSRATRSGVSVWRIPTSPRRPCESRLLRERPEILDRAPEPLVEGDERRVAQEPLALRDVRERVGHVARARRPVPARQAPPEDRLELRDDLEQAHPVTAADVEHLAADAGRARGEQVGLDDVVDVREVPRLGAVAVDLEGLPAEAPEDESGNDRGVLGLRVLPRTEDVEVAEPDRLDAVEARPDGCVLLTGRLRHR